MATRAMGPGAGWRWLKQAINLGRHNPKAIFGAVALLALVAMIPSLAQVALQQAAGADTQTVLMVMGVLSLVLLVAYPLLIGGMLRVIHASETGQPTRATALFDTFRSGHDAGRLIGFGVLLTAVYLAIIVALILTLGEDLLAWYGEILSASIEGATPNQMPALPALPAGFGIVLALVTLLGLFFGCVYSIGLGQVALGGRGIGNALADGVAGTLKNALPIVVLAVIAIVLLVVFILVFGLLAALLALIGGLVHASLAVILLLPIYIGMLLVMYVVMFGVMYHMWRDICGGQPLAAGDGSQLEV